MRTQNYAEKVYLISQAYIVAGGGGGLVDRPRTRLAQVELLMKSCVCV